MKIIYVARHGNGLNDEEGAIAFALRKLGHKVVPIQENQARMTIQKENPEGDLLLFHKWLDVNALPKVRCKKKVFWYFDLVDWPHDPTLRARSEARKKWMKDVIVHVDAGFCTDGDWALKAPKYHWLPQGFDERSYSHDAVEATTDILFTGGRNGGAARESFVDDMTSRYGRVRFKHIARGLHGVTLAQEIARAKVVVAPDSPVTHNYWSNRVYLTLGFGGFLLHPQCDQLEHQYHHGKEIVFYNDRSDLYRKIDAYLDNPEIRRKVASAGEDRTLREHTYAHRCRKLIEVVERL